MLYYLLKNILQEKQKLIMCILTDVASRKKNRNKYLVIYQTSHFSNDFAY